MTKVKVTVEVDAIYDARIIAIVASILEGDGQVLVECPDEALYAVINIWEALMDANWDSDGSFYESVHKLLWEKQEEYNDPGTAR